MSSDTDVHKPSRVSDRSYELSPASGDDVDDFTQDPGGQPFRVPLCCGTCPLPETLWAESFPKQFTIGPPRCVDPALVVLPFTKVSKVEWIKA